MTSFVTRDSTHLGTDRILTSPTMQAIYDNLSAIAEGAQAPSGYAVGMTRLNSGAVSAAATLDIVMTAYTAWRNKLLLLTSFLPATDSVALWMRSSTNGGGAYDAGGSDYGHAFRTLNTLGAAGDTVGSASAALLSNAFVGNAAGEGINSAITLYDTISAVPMRCSFQGNYSDNGGAFTLVAGMVGRVASQDNDAIRILFSSGNIASGRWALYGFN